MIIREDMLELTRRMTRSRNCFDRIAGSYMDRDGYSDGSFNISFLKLSAAEAEEKLRIAKTIPFAKTNEELKLHPFPGRDTKQICQLLMGLRECGLKNDALMDTFCEWVAGRYRSEVDYGIFLYHGRYDVPVKASDKERLWESEEVYDFLICAVGPLTGDYEMTDPEWGFLFPAFTDRSTDLSHIAVYNRKK
ncbi:MAG: DUF4317 family protein [Blautia sp.]|nr:DUF4317 family protein [Blautia sp.]